MISLCMIVKNEENSLERCLKSAKDIVDEIILVDTGSTDRTKDIAKSFNCKIYDFPWINDFSEARNFSISKASCDWILLLDGDDEIRKEYRSSIKKLTENDEVDLFCFKTLSLFKENNYEDLAVSVTPRLFKNKAGYRFTGKIHEQILCEIKNVNPKANIIVAPIEIYHYGYIEKVVEEKNKNIRNLTLLQEELEKDPQNSLYLFCLGNEYYSQGDLNNALKYYKLVHDTPKYHASLTPLLMMNLLFCTKELKLYEDFYTYAEEALKLNENYTDVYYLKGVLNHSLGEISNAIVDLSKAISIGAPHPSYEYIYGAGTFLPLKLLYKIYYDLQDYNRASYCAAALTNFKEVTEIEPLRELLKCLSKTGASEESVKEIISNILIDGDEKSYLYLIDLLESEGHSEIALYYLEELQNSSNQA